MPTDHFSHIYKTHIGKESNLTPQDLIFLGEGEIAKLKLFIGDQIKVLANTKNLENLSFLHKKALILIFLNCLNLALKSKSFDKVFEKLTSYYQGKLGLDFFGSGEFNPKFQELYSKLSSQDLAKLTMTDLFEAKFSEDSIDILDKNFTYFSWGDKNADFMLNVRLSYPPISKTSVWKNPEFWSEDEMKNMILKVAWIIKNSEKLKSRFYRPILWATRFVYKFMPNLLS